MATVIVGFSKPNTWKPFSALIMAGYGIPYDHVYTRLHSDTYSRDLIYQASGLAVNFMSPDIFNSKNVIIKEFTVAISDENKVKMIQFAIDNAGKPYGIKEAFGMAIVRVAELLGKKIKNPFNDGKSTYVCSELIGYILEEYSNADIPGDVYDFSPKVIYDYLTSLNASDAKAEQP